MAQETELLVQAGVPFARRIRVVNGKDIWSSLADFEVRSDLRTEAREDSPLIADLASAMTVAFNGNDIVIDLALTGHDTRRVRAGYYDVVLSDIGTTDARAVRVLFGALMVNPVVTSEASA